ncbi:hypothetical protein THASP1DRAFT_30156 [Thamnocephalis sphaerospora]|uniref:Uncharacterized protein n=1 Tax=Thamnocephalis sphaerospora TaxID=78915 RepID=A0A4P9XRA5_9FUNG|nr:hypothetical protein THASP1DRAFT_30156 [Thamnocephalis sphaerospora]|eukprot:RKP08041.1 hypothetical protein THASP1DRAFT_30156 [Thamnocephalis sphaerospora]
MNASDTRITICAARHSKTRLYCKVVEVTYRHSSSSGHLGDTEEREKSAACSNVLTLYVHSLESWNDRKLCSLRIKALNTHYALIEYNYNIAMFDTFKLPDASRTLKPVVGSDACNNTFVFQHGWVIKGYGRICLKLLHRRAIVVEEKNSNKATVLRIGDGSVITSYDLPFNPSFKHILGDLALVVCNNNATLILYDAFTGVKIRTICDRIRYGNTYVNMGSPVYLSEYSKWRVRRAKEEECQRLSLPPPSHRISFVRRLRWYDFMPEISKQDKRRRRATPRP